MVQRRASVSKKRQMRPIMLVGLAPHGIGLVAIHLGEFLARLLKAQPEMVGQPLTSFLVRGMTG